MPEIKNTSRADESLWRFALAFYARHGVAETCLLLQDEHKVNVCMLIGLHWLDMNGCILSIEELVDLSEHTQKWTHEIVDPLRALRRTLKKPLENFPQDELHEQVHTLIKQAELLAEKKLLTEIERWAKKISVAVSPSYNSNIKRYFTHLGMDEIFATSIIQKLTSQ
jgi:uncharacterized protein (TIGR02444 family)